jgi:NAD(P)-dependent dehydrogenase (short-subunit alcohol dehydrogenase family)
MSGLPDLRGKVAVVTGGASGIGKGIAVKLAEESMRVVIADIERSALEETAAEIGAAAIHVDVSDLTSVEALADEVADRFGTAHVVCNNAGVGPMAPVRDLKIEDWRWMIDVNLYGVIHGVQAFLPVLAANADGGHIVNTASMAGLVAQPRQAAYSVTKFGVVALTETLAAELAADESRVGVTVLCPGTVHTSIGTSTRNRQAWYEGGGLRDVDLAQEDNPGRRWITPEEVGAAAVRAIKRGDLYAMTHPERYAQVARRHEAIAAAFRRAAAAATAESA